jgi:hypothetical protein
MADTPYCSVEQFFARYPDRRGNVDEEQLYECLMDATRVLSVELPLVGIDPEDADADLLMQACRQMTERVVPSGDGADIPVGATQASFTAGPYNQQFTMKTPYGSPKFGDSEKRLFGIGHRIGCGRIGGA